MPCSTKYLDSSGGKNNYVIVAKLFRLQLGPKLSTGAEIWLVLLSMYLDSSGCKNNYVIVVKSFSLQLGPKLSTGAEIWLVLLSI